MNQKIFTIILFSALNAQAQITRPPAGIDVNETHIVQLPTVIPSSCISIASSKGTIFLDKAKLEELVASKPQKWTNKSEREKVIEATRAEKLLTTLSQTRNSDNCFTPEDPTSTDIQYVVLREVENSNAAIKVSRTKEMTPSASVTYMGSRCGNLCGRGDILINIPNENNTPFFSVVWWVS